MLRRLLRLRAVRLLALLAALLLAGVEPHAHASPTGAGVAVLATGDHGGEDGGQPADAAAHCGVCHAARAVVPPVAAGGTPPSIAGRVDGPDAAAAAEGLPGQAPSRPPRGAPIA